MTTNDPIKSRMRLIDILAAIVLLVVIGGTIGGGLLPLYARTASEEEESFRLRNEMNKLDGLSHTLTQLEGDLGRTEDRLKVAESRLPSATEQDQFMTQVAQVADEAGLTVETITPKPQQEASTYRVMPMQITGTGSFETCYRFLTGLRKMKRLTRLDDLKLQLESTTPGADAKPADASGKIGEDGSTKAAGPICRITVGLSTFRAR